MCCLGLAWLLGTLFKSPTKHTLASHIRSLLYGISTVSILHTGHPSISIPTLHYFQLDSNIHFSSKMGYLQAYFNLERLKLGKF